MNDILWYKEPATKLHESLPVGNGRIGAMVFGGIRNETMHVDESTFWSGCASDNDDREGMKELGDRLRKLLVAGEYEEADKVGRNFVGNKGNYGTSLPVGRLHINLTGSSAEDSVSISDYRRQLDLGTAVALTEFTLDGARHTRETFASNPAGIFATRCYAGGARLDLELNFEGIDNNVTLTGRDGEDYILAGDAFESLHSDGQTGVRLAGRIRLRTDGRHDLNGIVAVTGATYVEIYLDMTTNMFAASPDTECRARLDAASAIGYETLKARHIADHASLYNRMEFELKGRELSDLTTDTRLKRLVEGSEDLGLVSTMFNYGRYLLIASDRRPWKKSSD
jgi:alpha-L-fucosidase 2